MKLFYVVLGIFLTTSSAVVAYEFLPGFPPGLFGSASRGGVAVPAPTGSILMVDGVSLVLQVDGASTICMAGGC